MRPSSGVILWSIVVPEVGATAPMKERVGDRVSAKPQNVHICHFLASLKVSIWVRTRVSVTEQGRDLGPVPLLPDDLPTRDILQHVTQRQEDSSHSFQLGGCVGHWILVPNLLLSTKTRAYISIRNIL